MKMIKVAVLILLLAAAFGIGQWRYASHQETHLRDPLGTRLSFDYRGTAEHLFQMLSEKSGVQYQVNPAVRERSVDGSYKNESVVQIQQDAAKKAHLRYRPLDDSGKVIGVDPA